MGDRRLTWILTLVFVFGLLTGCARSMREETLLTWRVAEAGPGCSATVTTRQPHGGNGSLEIVSQSRANDPGGMEAFVRVRINRVDGQPLGTLGEFADPAAHLTIDMFRDRSSGQGMPAYAMPYVTLHVRTADRSRAELLWEAAYNGYPPRGGVFPEGRWVRRIPLHEGDYWMRTDRNFNVGSGFQPLTAWAEGHVTTHGEQQTLSLTDDTLVTAIEIGFGEGVPGLLRAFVDDLRVELPGGRRYRLNFELPR